MVCTNFRPTETHTFFFETRNGVLNCTNTSWRSTFIYTPRSHLLFGDVCGNYHCSCHFSKEHHVCKENLQWKTVGKNWMDVSSLYLSQKSFLLLFCHSTILIIKLICVKILELKLKKKVVRVCLMTAGRQLMRTDQTSTSCVSTK